MAAERTKHILHCIELLLNDQNPDSINLESNNEKFLVDKLKDNDKFLTAEIRKYKLLEDDDFLNYFNQSVTTDDDRYWNIVLLCLKLIQALCDSISSSELCNENEAVELLSLNQQKSIRKCLQFVVALGIIPNLMPSVKCILKTPVLSYVQNLDLNTTPKKHYYRLVTCLPILLQALRSKTLGNLIFTHHAHETLIALLQLCHAPIKKIEQQENKLTNTQEKRVELSCANLDSMLHKIKGCDIETDEDTINQMFKDRIYFEEQLSYFTLHVSPMVLLPNVLIFQNQHLGNVQKQKKLPKWLQNICNEMLTNMLILPFGVKQFIEIVFDSMTDTDLKDGTINTQRIESVSRIISCNPVKHISQKDYLEEICAQISQLLHIQNSSMDGIFAAIASCIFHQLCEIDSVIAKITLNRLLFSPFWKCIQENNLLYAEDEILLASENELTQSFEDIHKIFVIYRSVLSEEALKFLLPFFHLNFFVFCQLLNSALFLKNIIFDLLVTVLKNSSEISAVTLLLLATFEDISVPNVKHVTNLNCVFGDSGGISIFSRTRKSDDIFEEVELKCQAIVTLLQALADKKLKMSYFLQLLKRAAIKSQNVKNKDGVKHFVNTLVMVHLLEELSDSVEENIGSNINEAIEIIAVALECGDKEKCEEPFCDSETTLTLLVILSTLLSYQNQLSSSQWNLLKKCLPGVDNICNTSNNENLQSIAKDICIAIRTRGAVLKANDEKPSTAKNQTRTTSINQLETNLSRDFNFSKDFPQNCESQKAKLIQEIAETDKSSKNTSKIELTLYERAMQDIEDSSLPIRGHGLIELAQLIQNRDKQTVEHKNELVQKFKRFLVDEDSYIYLAAIKGLSAVGDVDVDLVLPLLLTEFQNQKEDNLDYSLKIGEALLKICKNLGDLTSKFRNELLDTFLTGAQNPDVSIKTSSLSNLAEVCSNLKFSIGFSLQKILACVKSILEFDSNIEVRRAAALVLRLLLQGAGKDTISILENEMREIYRLLKKLYNTETDEPLRLQILAAKDEIDEFVISSFRPNVQMEKEISIFPS